MQKRRSTYSLFAIFLLCALFTAGADTYAQTPVQNTAKDSVIQQRQPPKARARRQRTSLPDSLQRQDTLRQLTPTHLQPIDSMRAARMELADSLDAANRREMQELQQPVVIDVPNDSLQQVKFKEPPFMPNPTRATWLAVVFPGGGQIYNRKYWKLPIFYGGFAGCAYALTWNSKMYKDYSQAYLDIMDSNPSTNSYEQLLPPNSRYSEEQLQNTLKRRKDMFRRYRDLSIFAFIAVYILSIVDAYVDAELSNFDISPDLSMGMEPAVINHQHNQKEKSVGIQCVLRF